MAASITDLIDRVTDSTTGRPVIGALAAPGKAIGAPSVNIADVTNWTTTSAIHVSIYKTMVVSGVTVKDPTTQTDWKGTLAGTVLSNLTLTGGTDRPYVAGDIIELTPTARFQKDLYDLLITLFNQDATLKPAPIQTALGLGAGALNGWNVLGYTPNTVTALGNRSYQMVYNAVDLTGTLSAGMRLRTTRTVAAPTQCTSLNGTTQYYSKTSPAGMTFTDDFVVSAWIKLSSYPATGINGTIASRFNGTSGWSLLVNSSGQVQIAGFNGAAGNYSLALSYQSIPLNKWVHVAAQLDMSSFTASTTTSYIMLDGVDVPTSVARAGTSPTSLVQAGNLEIGTNNATAFFPGKIAQVAIFSAKVTQSTIQGYISQGLAGTETNLISAYSFNNSINDLNTTNANNLTANGSAVATNADSPFGGQAGGSISSTLDYGIVQSASFSTNSTVVVQVPEGCTIPTSGGVSAVAYSSQAAPYGFPREAPKWKVMFVMNVEQATGGPIQNTWYGSISQMLTIPVGKWTYGWKANTQTTQNVGSSTGNNFFTLSTSSSAEDNKELTVTQFNGSNVSNITQINVSTAESDITTTAATPVYLMLRTTSTSDGNRYLSFRGDYGATVIYAKNAYL